MVGQWLASVPPGEAATLAQAPRDTIIPAAHADTGGRRALDALEKLRPEEPLALYETLGQGGMGVVRMGEQRALGRRVAVKTLRADRRTEAATLDLLREAWVTGSLEHPNVVPVYDIELDGDGSPMIVLKRIDGHAWSELMADAAKVRERFGHEDLLAWNLDILMQVLNAIRFAHSRGIVHRDLKPDNVMIGDFGEVYVLDWGIAVALRDDGTGRLPLASAATDLAGTPCYMAPEMLGRDTGLAITERTDIYLAGAVLFEILAGKPPHEGATAIEVISSVVASDPQLPADAPPDLARICKVAMDADPDGRFENAEQLRLALRGYLQRRGSARLAEAAHRRLAALRAAATAPGPHDPVRRQELYNLFGAARFGFHEALSSWRDNHAARDGLRQAIEVMVDHELGAGEPRAAAAILAELEGPPAQLAARVARGVEEAGVRQRALEQIALDHDAAIGTRTRMFGTLLLGVGFTVLPTIAAVREPTALTRSNAGWTIWSGVLMLAVVAFGVWARQSMTRTAFNRRVFMTTLFVFVMQGVLYLGAWRLDIDPVRASILMMLGWTAIAGMAAIAIDPRLWPCAVGYALAFGVAATWPETRFWMMAASNAVLTVNAVISWRPDELFPSAEERTAATRR